MNVYCGSPEPISRNVGGDCAWSVSNELTILIESEIQSFKYSGRGDPKIYEMHLHKLPWSVEKLLALGTANVRLKATLSYFVQPNPSERGNLKSLTCHSHGLRFALKRPGETLEAFNRRINKAHCSGEGTVGGNFDQEGNWVIGPVARDVGSLHSDIWDSSAADLADLMPLAFWRNRFGFKMMGQMMGYIDEDIIN